jgi:hypothetical protein
MKKKLVSKIVMAGALCAVIGSVDSALAVTVTLDSLLVPGTSLTVGGVMVFDHFGWFSVTVPSTGINIEGIDASNPLFVGNFGIDIQGSIIQSGVGSVDAELTFAVHVNGPPLISDVHQVVKGSGIGTFAASVSELVLNAPSGTTLASLFNLSSSAGDLQFGDPAIVPPQHQIWINKFISATVIANDQAGNGNATISDIQQTFSVPDAGLTLGLMGLGMMGLGAIRRKLA